MLVAGRMGDVFSFVADAYHDDQEVRAPIEPYSRTMPSALWKP